MIIFKILLQLKAFQIIHLLLNLDHLMKTAMATCTMAKVMRHSGPFSNEGINVGLQIGKITPEPGNEESIVKKRCDKLKESFYQSFRTLEGQCNNLDQPLLGSTRHQLSRLLPGDYKKFQKETFNQKPSNLSM